MKKSRFSESQIVAILKEAELGTPVADLFDYIEVFYNRSRRHSTLGCHSPVQFLQDRIKTQHERKLAA